MLHLASNLLCILLTLYYLRPPGEKPLSPFFQRLRSLHTPSHENLSTFHKCAAVLAVTSFQPANPIAVRGDMLSRYCWYRNKTDTLRDFLMKHWDEVLPSALAALFLPEEIHYMEIRPNRCNISLLLTWHCTLFLFCCFQHPFKTPLFWIVCPLCENYFATSVVTAVQKSSPLET